MGVNICVYQKIEDKFKRIPLNEWDWIRQGWDRQFRFETECDWEEDADDVLKRPKNADAEMALLGRVPVKYRRRYEKLICLLIDHPDYWVLWSY